MEDLADNVFAQRHVELERREKSRWASWGTRKCHRRLKRWEHTYALGARVKGRMKQALTKGKQILQISSSVHVRGDYFCLLLFFFLQIYTPRCGGRSFGYKGGMLTSGEESSAEWRWAQLDADVEQRSEEWLVRSKELQMNPPVTLHPSTPEHKTCFCDHITLTWGFAICLAAPVCLLFMSFSVTSWAKWYKSVKSILFCFRKRAYTWF